MDLAGGSGAVVQGGTDVFVGVGELAFVPVAGGLVGVLELVGVTGFFAGVLVRVGVLELVGVTGFFVGVLVRVGVLERVGIVDGFDVLVRVGVAVATNKELGRFLAASIWRGAWLTSKTPSTINLTEKETNQYLCVARDHFISNLPKTESKT